LLSWGGAPNVAGQLGAQRSYFRPTVKKPMLSTLPTGRRILNGPGGPPPIRTDKTSGFSNTIPQGMSPSGYSLRGWFFVGITYPDSWAQGHYSRLSCPNPRARKGVIVYFPDKSRSSSGDLSVLFLLASRQTASPRLLTSSSEVSASRAIQQGVFSHLFLRFFFFHHSFQGSQLLFPLVARPNPIFSHYSPHT